MIYFVFLKESVVCNNERGRDACHDGCAHPDHSARARVELLAIDSSEILLDPW